MKRTLFLLALLVPSASAATYTVQRGDTLSRIAQAQGVSVEQLSTLNSLRYSNLEVGQQLVLPDGGLNSSRQTPVIPRSYTDMLMPAPQPGKLQRGLFVPNFGFRLNAASSNQTRIARTTFEWQTMNNCGPTAISAILGHYGMKVPQSQYQRRLRPNGGYMTVESGVKLLKDLGFKVSHKRGGTVEDMKRAVSKGPVLVLQWHSVVGKTPHFRVVTGYDRQRDLFYMNDPLSGPLTALTSHDFDILWGTQGKQYVEISR